MNKKREVHTLFRQTQAKLCNISLTLTHILSLLDLGKIANFCLAFNAKTAKQL